MRNEHAACQSNSLHTHNRGVTQVRYAAVQINCNIQYIYGTVHYTVITNSIPKVEVYNYCIYFIYQVPLCVCQRAKCNEDNVMAGLHNELQLYIYLTHKILVK